MGIYEDLLARDAKLIPGGAAQNTARGAQVREYYWKGCAWI
jgi:adenosine kinase